MKVRLSEFTYKRLVEGLGQELVVYSIDEHGFYSVEVPTRIVNNATKNFGSDLDHAINEIVNENQRRGLWPKH